MPDLNNWGQYGTLVDHAPYGQHIALLREEKAPWYVVVLWVDEHGPHMDWIERILDADDACDRVNTSQPEGRVRRSTWIQGPPLRPRGDASMNYLELERSIPERRARGVKTIRVAFYTVAPRSLENLMEFRIDNPAGYKPTVLSNGKFSAALSCCLLSYGFRNHEVVVTEVD